MVEANSEAVIVTLVIAGVGIGFMREDLAREADASGAVMMLERGRARTFLQFLYRTNRSDDPEIRALLSIVRKLWPNVIAISRR